jgi:hypothetical protein
MRADRQADRHALAACQAAKPYICWRPGGLPHLRTISRPVFGFRKRWSRPPSGWRPAWRSAPVLVKM